MALLTVGSPQPPVAYIHHCSEPTETPFLAASSVPPVRPFRYGLCTPSGAARDLIRQLRGRGAPGPWGDDVVVGLSTLGTCIGATSVSSLSSRQETRPASASLSP